MQDTSQGVSFLIPLPASNQMKGIMFQIDTILACKSNQYTRNEKKIGLNKHRMSHIIQTV